MDAVISNDSPLAEYLEGQGEGHAEHASPAAHEFPFPSPPSFAPQGPSNLQARFRKRLPRQLRLTVPPNRAVSRILQHTVNARLGRQENAHFLEQFRYILVASQLLSPHISTSHYSGLADTSTSRAGSASSSTPSYGQITVSLRGAIVTATGAFALVWVLYWARGGASGRLSLGRVAVVLLLLGVLTALGVAFARRQWLQYLRRQAIEAATEFVATSQAFDATATAAMTLIQEVEVVSRGYRISSPLPPVSRMEERSQTRRCTRLRRTLHSCLATALPPFLEAGVTLRPLAVDVDLEKYFDIYELSATEIHDAERSPSPTDAEDAETLPALKTLLHRLYTLRRIVLCCLLALDAEGGKADFARWGVAVDALQHLCLMTAEGEEKLRKILSEEEQFPTPATPKSPIAPGRERVRQQLRRLGSLSQGIRGLQAKLHVLREESDKTLQGADDPADLGADLWSQYESIGNDLRFLQQEWESGKAMLALSLDKNEKRSSRSSNPLGSPTLSLGGVTAVDGSPTEALHALNGDERPRWSIDLSASDDGEVFEAVAAPRPRSTLSREDRLTKMKEERSKAASAKERVFANTSMIRELESVITLRPSARAGHSRITSM
ncbi:MAG: hypothetical protein M1838_001542 [Thelocarpon superellum]|nr:MAG: hypothetical protein M1838_001542 [Thelocarpon superellum]